MDHSKSSPWAPVRHTHGLMESRVDATVTVRRVDPASLLAKPVVRCVRCGKTIDDEAVTVAVGALHERCRPKPAPVVELQTFTPQAGRVRTTHLSRRDGARVLDWLEENGPSTARAAGWALGLDTREVALLLRSLEGRGVECVGVLLTGRRGRPPALWQVRAAVAA